jgi:hypothetical protein
MPSGICNSSALAAAAAAAAANMSQAAGDWGGGDTRGIAGMAGPMRNGNQGQLLSCNVFGNSNSAYDSNIAKCLGGLISCACTVIDMLSFWVISCKELRKEMFMFLSGHL